jgi:hypothetical protein
VAGAAGEAMQEPTRVARDDRDPEPRPAGRDRDRIRLDRAQVNIEVERQPLRLSIDRGQLRRRRALQPGEQAGERLVSQVGAEGDDLGRQVGREGEQLAAAGRATDVERLAHRAHGRTDAGQPPIRIAEPPARHAAMAPGLNPEIRADSVVGLVLL